MLIELPPAMSLLFTMLYQSSLTVPSKQVQLDSKQYVFGPSSRVQ